MDVMKEVTIADLAVSIDTLSKITEGNSVAIENLNRTTNEGFARQETVNKELNTSIENLARTTNEGFARQEVVNNSLTSAIENLARATLNGFSEIRTEMADMKSELRGEMKDMKFELRAEMKSMKEEIIEVVERKDEQNKDDIRHLYALAER